MTHPTCRAGTLLTISGTRSMLRAKELVHSKKSLTSQMCPMHNNESTQNQADYSAHEREPDIEPGQEPLIGVREAAEILGRRCWRSIYNDMRKGFIPPELVITYGGRKMFYASELRHLPQRQGPKGWKVIIPDAVYTLDALARILHMSSDRLQHGPRRIPTDDETMLFLGRNVVDWLYQIAETLPKKGERRKEEG